MQFPIAKRDKFSILKLINFNKEEEFLEEGFLHFEALSENLMALPSMNPGTY